MSEEPLSEDLLEVLACPYCKVEVKLKGDTLMCEKCGREYPVVNGIPRMLPDELRSNGA
ncbi:MAG: Trm112 family protein [Candidatus Hadarchaeia archaeon]